MRDFLALAERFGTPYYHYDLDRIEARAGEFRAYLPGFRLYYAVKANPAPTLLAALRPLVDGADVASGGELERARAAGFEPRAISFAGPGKDDDDLRAASGVGAQVVESVAELERLGPLGLRSRVLLRVSPRERIQSFGVPIAGLPSPFGVDEEDLDAAARALLEQAEAAEFLGVHAHGGSQCSSAAGYARLMSAVWSIAARLEQEHGLVSSRLCFGGGIGAAEAEGQQGMDLRALGEKVRPLVAAHRPAELVLELGRALVAEAGTYVARVVATKVSRGKKFIILDGGTNHHLLSSPYYAPGPRPRPRLLNLSTPERATELVTVVGPLCTPLDVLGADVVLPELRAGDLVGIAAAGAYGLSLSPTLFLSHPLPRELCSRGGDTWE